MKNKESVSSNPPRTEGSVLDELDFSPAETLEIKVKAAVYSDLMRHIHEQGMTQKQLAARLAIPQPDVSNLLNGNISRFSISKLIRLAGKLELYAEIKLLPASTTQRAA